MPSMFVCYHCDPIQEFSGFEVWVRHQMEVHNISSEFYHPSATFLAHMSRYVNGNVGVRYDSRPGDLYIDGTSVQLEFFQTKVCCFAP